MIPQCIFRWLQDYFLENYFLEKPRQKIQFSKNAFENKSLTSFDFVVLKIFMVNIYGFLDQKFLVQPLHSGKKPGIASTPFASISTEIYWFMRLATRTKYFAKMLVSRTVLINVKFYVRDHNSSSLYGTFDYLAVSFFWQLTLPFYYTVFN